MIRCTHPWGVLGTKLMGIVPMVAPRAQLSQEVPRLLQEVPAGQERPPWLGESVCWLTVLLWQYRRRRQRERPDPADGMPRFNMADTHELIRRPRGDIGAFHVRSCSCSPSDEKQRDPLLNLWHGVLLDQAPDMYLLARTRNHHRGSALFNHTCFSLQLVLCGQLAQLATFQIDIVNLNPFLFPAARLAAIGKLVSNVSSRVTAALVSLCSQRATRSQRSFKMAPGINERK